VLLQAMVSHFSRHLLGHSCSCHEAALITWALGKLGHTFPPPKDTPANRSSSSSSKRPARKQQQQQQQQQVNAVAAASTGGAGEVQDQQQQSQQQQQQQQQRWYLDSLQQQLLLKLRKKLRGMSGRQLVMLLHGLALQRAKPYPDWLQAALAAGFSKLGELDGQGLANLLYALAVLGARPGPAWQAGFWKALVTQAWQQQQQRRRLPAAARQQWQQLVEGGDPRDEGTPSWVLRQKQRKQQRAAQIQQLQQQYVTRHPTGDTSSSGSSSSSAAVLTAVSWQQLHKAQELMGSSLPLGQLQGLLDESAAWVGQVPPRSLQLQWQALSSLQNTPQQQQQQGLAGPMALTVQSSSGSSSNGRGPSSRVPLFTRQQQHGLDQHQQQQGLDQQQQQQQVRQVDIRLTPLSPQNRPAVGIGAQQQHSGQ
jgi:hypothetical protein